MQVLRFGVGVKTESLITVRESIEKGILKIVNIVVWGVQTPINEDSDTT